jgi:hypothetical protein
MGINFLRLEEDQCARSFHTVTYRGVQVKCQESRSQSQNRKIARRMLNVKLEVLTYGALSKPVLKVCLPPCAHSWRVRVVRYLF